MSPSGLFRHARISYVSVVIGLALASFAYVQDNGSWRYDLGRATDRAGLYLFLVGPVLAGVTTLETWQHRRRFATLASGLPRPAALKVRPFADCLLWAWAMHLLVLTVYLSTALAHGAVGSVLYQSVLLQLVALAGYAGLGALVGWQARSAMTAPLLTGGILLLNVQGALTGERFREVTTLGTGLVDFVGQTTGMTHLLLQLAAFGALACAVLVAGSLAPRLVYPVTAALVLVAVGAGLAVTSDPQSRIVLDRSTLPYVCRGDEPQVCGPESAARYYPSFARALASVERLLPEPARAGLPRQFRLELPNAPVPARGLGLLEISTPDYSNSLALQDAALIAVTQPASCDDRSVLAPPPAVKVIAIRATVTGLLDQQLGNRLDGRYPKDLVDAVGALPAARSQAWLIATVAQMWSCRSDLLALPAGVAEPAYLRQ